MVRWDKAFQPPKEKVLSEKDLDRWAGFLKDRHLNIPALIFLETVKPISFLLHTLSVGAHPILSLFLGSESSTKIYELFQNREWMERLIQKLVEQKGERKNG
ncbi:MAG: hypothetical protein V2G43_06385 [bacterium JZ-2024 1]